jgi:hypothetical protein
MTPGMKKLNKMMVAVEVELNEIIDELYDAQHRKMNIYNALSNLSKKQRGFKKERANEKHLH